MAITFDSLSLRDIQIGFDSNLVQSAYELIRKDGIQEYELSGNSRLSGLVIENHKRYQPSLTFLDDTLQMACECGRLKDGPCVHVVALLLDWALDRAENDDEGEMLFEEAQPAQMAGRPAEPNAHPQIFPSASPQEIRADWQKRLENLTVKEMRELAAAWGVKLKGTLRDQVLAGLLEMIAAPETLPRVLQRLAPDAGGVLDLLCALYRTVPGFNLAQITVYLQAALNSPPKARPAGDCLQDLMRVGLVQNPTFTNLFPVPLQVLALPRVNPTLFSPWNSEPQQVELAQPFRFTRLALRLLLLAQGGRLHRVAPVQPQGSDGGSQAWPSKSANEKAAKEFEIIPEPIYIETGLRAALARDLSMPAEELDLAARLLDTGGLWPAHASKKVSEKLPAWLQISPQEQSRRLFALAAMFPTQLELDLARPAGFSVWRSDKGMGYPNFLNSLAQARLRLVHLLARLPQGQWFEIDSILRCLHGLQPGWLPEFISRLGTAYAAQFWENVPVWANVARRKVNPMDYEDWGKAYGPFYRAMLTHSLPWLGLLDVGLQAGKPVAVRLSEFGEFLVEQRAEFPLPALKSEAAPLAVNSAGVLMLDLEAASLDLVNLVVQIALPENTAHSAPSPHRLPYRLNDTHLGAAFEAGWTLEKLINHLQAGLRAPLPDALRAHLQHIWDRFGRLLIYEDMTLIELADDYALPELLAGSSLSQILLYTFSPRLVAVRSAGATDFIAELRNKGYTPRVEGGARG